MRENNVDRKASSDLESMEWVSRFRSSGLSACDFARQNGLTPSQLHYWIYAKHPKDKKTSVPPLFTEVKLNGLFAGNPWVAEIGMSEGVTIRLGSSASAQWVGELVRSLRKSC